jgi:hypothetical protein
MASTDLINKALYFAYGYSVVATWLLAGGFALVAWKTEEPPPRWWVLLVGVPALVSLVLGAVIVWLANR